MGTERWEWKGVEHLVLAKRRRRLKLARLPIEKKIRILVELQKMASGVRPKAGGLRRRPWTLPKG
jgi:hypothetical protein